MLQLVAVGLSIELQSRNGRQNWLPRGRNQRNWWLTRDCVTTCKTVWRARFTMLMAVRLLGLDKLRSKAEINHIAVTVFDVFLASPATHVQITTELACRDAGIFDFFSHGQSPWSYVIESGDFLRLHRECIDTLVV